ncbi:PorP/SprF family type IX secretion system membrane protein [Croceivirga thetidis]|uniref:PorP/SprF family type IX secretion system membrane protein n=1 Tax=Croceivirga thetidis TaxID=2721623 RepID=A0ABX1GSF9_9FLAO|nr:PorP/SprF family type IX secretion system membrane protein [Croceivirga thetidis]NKI32539.1 PorP/SprF family type IX secretion system membrane protein [Croceivirga thetidis]
MYKFIFKAVLFFFSIGLSAQTILLDDLRQHNLSNINSSLLNPTFSLDRNNPRSLSVWTRWQWQAPDGDPTTLFFNYTQGLGPQAAGGIGFFQNNTGAFQLTGGILNFSFAIPLDETGQSNLFFGSNVSFFQQKVVDNTLTDTLEDSFVGQFAPGIRVQVGSFNLGFTVENALNFDFSDSQREETGRVFGSLMSYDFPITLFGADSYLRPQAYVRSFPEADLQYGLVSLLQHPKFWVQGGYNNFYGISGGAGVTLFQNFSIGGLVEFGIDDVASEADPTFELVATYHFGKQQFSPQEAQNETDLEEEPEEGNTEEQLEEEKLSPEEPKLSRREQRRLEREQREEAKRLAEVARDSIQRAQEAKRWEEWNKATNDSLARVEEAKQLAEAEKLEQLRQTKEDSIRKVRQEEIRKEIEKAKQDSIARVEAQQLEEKPEPNERYQEVSSAEGLEPGYYLIANVFGTQRYFENFMVTLRNRGLEPKSFYRSVNKFNYVYLERYSTLGEARAARNSNFGGRYSGELWVFRVK